MRITIIKPVMAAFDNGNYSRLYEAGEQHEIGSVLMPQQLADQLTKGSVPAAPAFGHPGSRANLQRKPHSRYWKDDLSQRCAVIDKKPVDPEWLKKNAETLAHILGNDSQVHSTSYVTGDYPIGQER